MRIGDLAARAGVSARALRYYEQQGLLSRRHKLSDHIGELMRTRDSLDELVEAARAHREQLRTGACP